MSAPRMNHRSEGSSWALLAALSLVVLVWAPADARAQADDVDFELPDIITVTKGDRVGASGGGLDLRNIVQTAARRVTTIQEAPAIVTVITDDEIADRGWTNLEDALDTIPGWFRVGGIHNQFPFTNVRGQSQAVMYMHNGISMFDPMFNVASMWRVQPLETIKRVEVVTGPGGVLWGANSFLGIVNVITKDADDVDGYEAAVRIGDGNGDRRVLRGYVMGGFPDLLGGSAKLFLHTSFETYHGPGYRLPVKMFSQPLPQPNSQLLFGPLTQGDPPQSFLFNLNAKLSLGALNIYVSAPYVQRNTPLGFPGIVIEQNRAEDTARDPVTGELLCPRGPPIVDPTGTCLDPARRSRENKINWFDRYIIAEYQKRLAGGTAGFTAKAYAVQFNRDFAHLGILKPIAALLEGGLSFGVDGTNYRAGGVFDVDIDVNNKFRVLLGTEAFHEWLPANTSRSLQGTGVEANFFAPYNLGRLPLPCPVQPNDTTGGVEFVEGCPLTFAFATSRTVLGAYINPQWSPTKKLTFDGGVRFQVAPQGAGDLGYPLQTVFSGAAVWGFTENWHLKLNYAEGFRPPVFNNLVGNGDAVQIDGDPDLLVERSRASQIEVNARLFRGEKSIREFNFRADYSYTTMENFIQILAGRYVNTGDRGIHSAEFLGKLYIQGNHRIEFGYTWLKIAMADKGAFISMPEHWFNLAGVFQLGKNFRATTNLRIAGAMEDPNRMVEYRDYVYDDLGRPARCNNAACTMPTRENLTVWPHELVVDRLPPVGDLTVGLTYTGFKKIQLSAWAYNAFNQLSYQPDAFQEYEPRLEFQPNPNRDFRFVLNAVMKM